MTLTQFLKQNWFLTERAKTWLIEHPERLEEFAATYTSNPAHFRRLDYEEDREFERFEHALCVKRNPPPKKTAAQLVEGAFVDREAHRALGESMAAMLYETANRPGFMRTMFFHMDNHTCPEFTTREQHLAKRITRRLKRHVDHREFRHIIRTYIRQQ